MCNEMVHNTTNSFFFDEIAEENKTTKNARDNRKKKNEKNGEPNAFVQKTWLVHVAKEKSSTLRAQSKNTICSSVR